ncbi:hypothetical protein F5880DRAFT_1618986 [Lentinula raphanica]|nr:hypothetical protein F5880DRAFT_1618986 [Lentinula raphanica]
MLAGILRRLCQRAVPQNSEQHFSPPKNFSDIQNQTQIDVEAWITKESDEKPTFVFWIYGAVGVGKTAFAEKISEKFAARPDKQCQKRCLAAKFYFCRSDFFRNNMSYLIPTIAYQLAVHDDLGSLFKPMLDAIISEKPHILNTNLLEQFQELLYRPCTYLLAHRPFPEAPRLIVLNGLDECCNPTDIEELLSLI